MKNLQNNQLNSNNKSAYYITMVVSMLLGVALVLGTPFFNDFGSKQNSNTLSPITNQNSLTGGSSY